MSELERTRSSPSRPAYSLPMTRSWSKVTRIDRLPRDAHSTSEMGHSRPRRASSKSGHVRSALEAEVNSTGYCGLMPLPETLFKLLNWSVLDRALRTQRF
jgi:hypothetical protein